MKLQLMKKMVAIVTTGVLAAGTLTACGGSQTAAPAADGGNDAQQTDTEAAGETTESLVDAKGGKILFLSNLSSGAYYDYYVAFYEKACEDLGYDFQVVYGDGFNDPDGNLKAIRNAYTSDVVGIIACQDGGISSILEEYPDVYVATLNSDMDAVFNEDGTSHSALSSDHFLGTMGDGYISGEELGKDYAQEVIDKGYKKVATIIFPVYAYPKHTAANAAFRAAIEEYNATASEPIEIIGDETVLEFKPLGSDYFMEADHQDLDCIAAFCAGTQFVYPTVLEAKSNGSCAAKTKIITNGFEAEEGLFADSGDEEGMTIGAVTIANPEAAVWPLVMIDNAVQGVQFKDYAGPERLDSGVITMDTTEEFQAMKNNSPLWDADLSKLSVSWDEMKNYFGRYNADATYADLNQMVSSVSIDNYMQ